MIFRVPVVGFSIAAAAVLAACGGGGGGAGTGGGGGFSSLAGIVVDGYIEGAKVCLDLNNNQACDDASEPFAISKADGSYTLDVARLSAEQIRGAHLLTLVGPDAKDKDDAGQTLAQAGKAAFNLMAPAGAFMSADGKTLGSAVISPLTTLVSHDMIAGNGKALADAESAVRARMGLAPDANLRQDFVARNDAAALALRQQAQVLAAALGEVRKAAAAVNGTSEREALMAALGYLQQNMAALQIAARDAAGARTVDRVKNALATQPLAPVAAALLDEARRFTASNAVDVAAVLASGAYGFDYCPQSAGSSCKPAYYKMSANGGTLSAAQYGLLNGAWVQAAPNGSDFYLTAVGWTGTADTGTLAPDGQGGALVTDANLTQQMRVSMRTIDISAKPASALGGAMLPSALAGLTFPAGSALYWLQSNSVAQVYRLHTASPMRATTCSQPACPPAPLSTLAQLTAQWATPSSIGATVMLQWDNLAFTFDAGGTASGGTVTLWSPCSGQGGCAQLKTGSANYDIITVSGQQILIIRAPAHADGRSVIFAVKGGVVYGGSLVPAGTTQSGSPMFNRTAVNAMLGTLSYPAVLD